MFNSLTGRAIVEDGSNWRLNPIAGFPYGWWHFSLLNQNQLFKCQMFRWKVDKCHFSVCRDSCINLLYVLAGSLVQVSSIKFQHSMNTTFASRR